MKNDQSINQKAWDKNQEQKKANERRIEEIKNINNKYVRTQRHLEQHSDISDPDNLRNSSKIQQEREERMDNLKNIVAYGKHEEVNEIENLNKKIEFTDNYIKNNSDNMDEETLQRSKIKQEHRKEQLDFFE